MCGRILAPHNLSRNLLPLSVSLIQYLTPNSPSLPLSLSPSLPLVSPPPFSPRRYESMYAGVTFGQFMIKLRVKVEQVNDEARVKAVIQVRQENTV